MGVVFKPLKLILFALALFGILSLEIQGKKVITHLSDWITSKKTRELAKDWSKDKAEELLDTAKEKVSDTLVEKTPQESEQEPKEEELIPGTAIPKSVAKTERKAKILQKLDLENELISGDDKKELKDMLNF